MSSTLLTISAMLLHWHGQLEVSSLDKENPSAPGVVPFLTKFLIMREGVTHNIDYVRSPQQWKTLRYYISGCATTYSNAHGTQKEVERESCVPCQCTTSPGLSTKWQNECRWSRLRSRAALQRWIEGRANVWRTVSDYSHAHQQNNMLVLLATLEQ
jgi:hypothetical protein